MQRSLILALIVVGVVILLWPENETGKARERKYRTSSRQLPSKISEEEQRKGLQMMNAMRCNLAPLPLAKTMPALVWDKELAAVAQAWADRGKFEHSSSGYGENLAWRSPSLSLEQAVKMWNDERASIIPPKPGNKLVFDTRNNGEAWCKGGWANCGHATQMYWAETTRVGCGKDSAGKFIVCNYSPPGNYQGRPVYEPASGSSSSATSNNTDACLAK